MDGQAVLRQTAQLLENGWCRGASARDPAGRAVAASDPAASAWSLLGALAAVSERVDTDGVALRDALWGISGVIPDASLDNWNEATGRTQDDALQLLARAEISLARHPPPARGWT